MTSRAFRFRSRIGVVVTTFNRPEHLMELVENFSTWTVQPTRIVVVNNGRPVALPRHVETIEPGRNIGLPGAISRGFEALGECDRVLVLDDDTLLQPDTLESMIDAGAGATTVPGEWTRSAVGDDRRVFPWSPTLLRREVIDTVVPPRTELFFGWDDWEYALRVVGAGFTLKWLADDVVLRQAAGSTWPGRAYLSARNLAYIRYRLGVRDRVFERPWKTTFMRGVRADGVLVRRGLFHGSLGRMGPPPQGVLPDW